MKIVVTGLIATYPLGGVGWDYLAYVAGFRRLGCDVLYLEDTGQWLYDPRTSTFTPDPSFHLTYLADTLSRADPSMREKWALRDAHDRYHGWSCQDVERFCNQADLFLNVSGACWLRAEYRGARCLAYLDSDPGYSQAKLLAVEQGVAGPDQKFSVDLIRAHQRFFSLGENLGSADCAIPTCGLQWHPTRQPIVLADWPFTYEPQSACYTTVMSWKTDVTVPILNGVQYGGKDVEFLKFIDLPAQTPVSLEVALAGEAPRQELQRRGWRIADAYVHSQDLDAYQAYLRRSRAEWSIAKNAYVASRSGWFSTRSAAYLALGKPVVVQDTGFSTHLPSGEGLFAFDSIASAAAAIDAVEADYRRHCEAARAIAVREFDSAHVLSKLLQDAGVS